MHNIIVFHRVLRIFCVLFCVITAHNIFIIFLRQNAIDKCVVPFYLKLFVMFVQFFSRPYIINGRVGNGRAYGTSCHLSTVRRP